MAKILSAHSVPQGTDAYVNSTSVTDGAAVRFERPLWAKAYNISVSGESVMVADNGVDADNGNGILIPKDGGPFYRPLSCPLGPSVIAIATGPAACYIEWLA